MCNSQCRNDNIYINNAMIYYMNPINTTNICVHNDKQRISVSIRTKNISMKESYNEEICCESTGLNLPDEEQVELQSQEEYNQLVKMVYSNAIPVKLWSEYTKSFIKTNIGISPNDIIYAQGICSDDVDASKSSDNVGQFPTSAKTFLGPFMSGGLAGYPFVGKLGLKAWASHVTKTGTLFISSMTHIGITKDGTVGKINRRGIAKPSDTCGAVKASVDWVIANTEEPNLDNFLEKGDYEFYKLIKILWTKRTELLSLTSLSDRMLRATELIRDSAKKYIRENLYAAVKDYVNKPVVVCSGIFINTDYEYDALIDVNYFAIYDPSDRSWDDKTSEYLEGLQV